MGERTQVRLHSRLQLRRRFVAIDQVFSLGPPRRGASAKTIIQNEFLLPGIKPIHRTTTNYHTVPIRAKQSAHPSVPVKGDHDLYTCLFIVLFAGTREIRSQNGRMWAGGPAVARLTCRGFLPIKRIRTVRILAKKHDFRPGVSLVETRIGLVVFLIVVLRSAHFRYLRAIGIRNANQQLAGADMAVMHLRVWQGMSGSDSYGPDERQRVQQPDAGPRASDTDSD